MDAMELAPGDTIIVRAGERIPADGIIESGVSSIDESTITGESLPRDKQPGDEVFSGTLNGNALLRVCVARAGQETILARVVRLVEEAQEKLTAMGSVAIGTLKQLRLKESPEAQQRIDLIVPVLEKLARNGK